MAKEKNKEKKEETDLDRLKKFERMPIPQDYYNISMRRYLVFIQQDKILLNIALILSIATLSLNIISYVAFLNRDPAEFLITTTNNQVYKIGKDFNKEFLESYLADSKKGIPHERVTQTVKKIDAGINYNTETRIDYLFRKKEMPSEQAVQSAPEGAPAVSPSSVSPVSPQNSTMSPPAQ